MDGLGPYFWLVAAAQTHKDLKSICAAIPGERQGLSYPPRAAPIVHAAVCATPERMTCVHRSTRSALHPAREYAALGAPLQGVDVQRVLTHWVSYRLLVCCPGVPADG
jgi:hypothetical protein